MENEMAKQKKKLTDVQKALFARLAGPTVLTWRQLRQKAVDAKAAKAAVAAAEGGE